MQAYACDKCRRAPANLPPLIASGAVRGDRFLTETVAEMARDAFRHPAGIDEDERGAVALNQVGEPIVVLRPHFVRHDGRRRRRFATALGVGARPRAAF